MLSKRSINMQLLQAIDQLQAPNVSQNLLTCENVVATKLGSLSKRPGYNRLGTRVFGEDGIVDTIRYTAERQGELLAFSDSGIYKYAGASDKMLRVSTAILTEVEKTSIIRNTYNQSYAQCYKFNGNLFVYYKDSRGGYRYSVLDETSNTLIVNDVYLGAITKLKLFEHEDKFYLFYVRASDSNLCLRQIDGVNFNIYSEVEVEGAIVSGEYKVKYFSSSAICIAHVTSDNKLTVAYYGIDGALRGNREAVPEKFVVDDTFLLFDIFVIREANLIHKIVWFGGGDVKMGTYDSDGAVVLSPVTLTTYTDLHSATFQMDLDDVFIAWDKTDTVPQEYLTYFAKYDYTGTAITIPTLLGAGISLVSEAFMVKGVHYVACCYTSVFQPNIFVMSELGTVIAKFNKDSALQHRTDKELAIPFAEGDTIRIPLETRTRLGREGDYYTENYGISVFDVNYGYGNATHVSFNKSLYISGSVIRYYDGATCTEAGFLLRPDESVISVTSNAVKASGFISSTGKLTFTAYNYGVQGNSITVAFTGGATAGSEVVTVVGNAISVQIESGVSTAAQIKTKLEASTAATALITVVLTTAGAMVSGVTVTLAGGVGGTMDAGSYQYIACYAWTDNFGDIHRSGMSVPVTFSAQKNDSVVVSVPSLFITEKNEVWIELYRTEVGGTVFYLTDSSLSNAPSIYTNVTDTTDDTDLIAKEIAYTTGDVLNNDSFPSCKELTIADNRLLMAGTESPDDVYYTKELSSGYGLGASNKLVISTGSKGGAIAAIRGFGDSVVVFKEQAIGIISGQYALSTGVEVSLKFDMISEEYGCQSRRVLEIDKGLIYQGQRGLCLLDKSLSSSFIGGPVEDLTRTPIASMALLPDKQQIIIISQSKDAICMDYGKGIFTTFTGHYGYSSTTIGNDYYYLDVDDRILKKNELAVTDDGTPIITSIRSPWYQVGALGGFQRLYELVIQGKLISPNGIRCDIYYDFEETPRESLVFSSADLLVYGLTTGDYGSVLTGPQARAIQQIRVQPRFQKCTAVSVAFSEYIPSGRESASACTWHGITLTVGLKKGAWKFDEALAASTLLSGS